LPTSGRCGRARLRRRLRRGLAVALRRPKRDFRSPAPPSPRAPRFTCVELDESLRRRSDADLSRRSARREGGSPECARRQGIEPAHGAGGQRPRQPSQRTPDAVVGFVGLDAGEPRTGPICRDAGRVRRGAQPHGGRWHSAARDDWRGESPHPGAHDLRPRGFRLAEC